jgi:hypothetical protein
MGNFPNQELIWIFAAEKYVARPVPSKTLTVIPYLNQGQQVVFSSLLHPG